MREGTVVVIADAHGIVAVLVVKTKAGDESRLAEMRMVGRETVAVQVDRADAVGPHGVVNGVRRNRRIHVTAALLHREDPPHDLAAAGEGFTEEADRCQVDRTQRPGIIGIRARGILPRKVHRDLQANLDRIVQVKMTKTRFLARNREEYQFHPSPTVANKAMVYTSPEQARWIREQQHWSFVSELKHPEGLVVLTYQNFDWHTFINWLCTVNDYIVRIEPQEVRVQLRNKISELQKLLT